MQGESVDTVVIGAGVVGLACTRALAAAGREVVVLEALGAVGSVTSARNSEVLHAGLYYPPGSLKAALCVSGRRALVDYCASRGVALRLCGKLVVAADATQAAWLEGLQAQAVANGVDDTRLLTGAAARALEPELAPGIVRALHSPSTGIVDSHALMLALPADAEALGAVVALRSPVRAVRVTDGGGFALDAEGGATIRVRRVVNAAGLAAPRVAAAIAGLAASHVPEAHFCKGSYFALAGRAPFSRLVYPVPEAAGLGVHLTLDLAGQARFGPDVQWLAVHDADAIDYAVDPARADALRDAIRRYWPGLRDDALVPAYSGVRPKIAGPGAPAADFVVSSPADHGVPGLVNLFGIESPGLTACLALADLVVHRIGG
ncbi:MAG: NAD(P)/FAD-dependent oxidoreductase [Betaproteobacteria bacterium]